MITIIVNYEHNDRLSEKLVKYLFYLYRFLTETVKHAERLFSQAWLDCNSKLWILYKENMCLLQETMAIFILGCCKQPNWNYLMHFLADGLQKQNIFLFR